MRIFLEFFVDNFSAMFTFYTEVLRFQVKHSEEDFVVLHRDSVQIHLLSTNELAPALSDQRAMTLAARTEICLELPDKESLDEEFKEVIASGWPIHDQLTYRPWNKWDFRLKDPEGAYLRISTAELPYRNVLP